MPRVVITGLGVISAIGLTRDAFWRSLVAGTCGIHTVNSTDFEQLRFKHAADVEGFVPEDHLAAKDISLMDRSPSSPSSRRSEAIAHAGLDLTPAMRETAAIVTGSCIGGRSAEEAGYSLALQGKPLASTHPLTIPAPWPTQAPAISPWSSAFTGPSYTISTACCLLRITPSARPSAWCAMATPTGDRRRQRGSL